MCLISICHKKKMTFEEFQRAWKRNPDGVGFAKDYVDRVHFKKGIMDVKEAFDFSEKLEVPFVVHFRKSSIGRTCPELTHPFEVKRDTTLELEGNVEKVLFMNGTNYFWEDYLNATGIYIEDRKDWSDARALASIISNGNERFLNKISAKFVVIDINQDKIYYYGEFFEDDGRFFSKNDWNKEDDDELKKKYQTTIYYPKKSGCNYGTSVKPWENDFAPHNMILRFLMNKITPKAAAKLWYQYQYKGVDFDTIRERAIKILKQQKPKDDYLRIQKIVNDRKEKFPDYEGVKDIPDPTFDMYAG